MRISRQAKQQTKARILEKASELFVNKGFEGTTTRDIAVAAGLAAGTLFNYFPSKETLAMTMVGEALARGREDHRRRRSGEEDLAEDLFLFIAGGLRRMRPLRPFLGPVLERSLSPFPRAAVCPEGEAARKSQLAAVGHIMNEHGFAVAPNHVSMTIYWSLYLGILAFWASDDSDGQAETRTLIDYSLRVFVRVVCGPVAEGGDDSET